MVTRPCKRPVGGKRMPARRSLPQPYLTVDEFCAVARCSRSTAYEWFGLGYVETKRLPHRRLVSVDSAARFLAVDPRELAVSEGA